MSKKQVFVSGDRRLIEQAGRPEDMMLHTQADAGSFVVDGARLGSDDYDFLGYFGIDLVAELLHASEYGEKEKLRKLRDDAPDLMIPDIALKLLPFILPKKLRDPMTGDLTEDFRTYAGKWGRAYALLWLSWELGGICIRRLGPTAISTAIGVWFRQRFGW